MTKGSNADMDPVRRRVVCIGECMIELAHTNPHDLQMAFGGDTSNTAVYLARLTENLPIEVGYVTALGDDVYSDAMLEFWREEGVGTSLVARLAGRQPGLYAIRTDDRGERSFAYWRGEAAARDVLRDGRDAALSSELQNVDLVYLSGISLSILDDDQRRLLLEILKGAHDAGVKIAFDGNFRPSGWPDGEAAKAWFRKVFEITTIALPTLEDECAMFGKVDEKMVAARLHDFGVDEVVVKLGKAGCFLSTSDHSAIIEACPVDRVIDSTAAGDSFNAAYLAARLTGVAPKEAARCGHRLASEVVCHRGAVIAREAMPDLGDVGLNGLRLFSQNSFEERER